ncbi:hypothetical protein PUNSTDRAFT_60336, partial [Punctularia strigosozonata HHB-11173 SS5]|uniref:uncharacterized protein n=1 Tax=Punctularia strigosozonata (strain HHB-11173) TaxID=741275 RepID=UPI0004417401
VSSVMAGHTKRITTNVIMLCTYCIGNAAGQVQGPNHVPWIVIGICYVICPLLLLALRVLLKRDNERRNVEPPDTT